MKPWQIKKKAEEFGISIESALKMRVRYLLCQIAQWPEYFDNDGLMPELSEREALEQIHDIARFRAGMNKPVPAGRITDEMIQMAKDVPIDSLIEFDRTGKAIAFCHADKSPSLSWNRKSNKAYCFPCGKGYSSIDVLMIRDGKTFIEAVKELNR